MIRNLWPIWIMSFSVFFYNIIKVHHFCIFYYIVTFNHFFHLLALCLFQMRMFLSNQLIVFIYHNLNLTKSYYFLYQKHYGFHFLIFAVFLILIYCLLRIVNDFFKTITVDFIFF